MSLELNIIKDDFSEKHWGITHDPKSKGNQSSPIYVPIEDCPVCNPNAEREK